MRPIHEFPEWSTALHPPTISEDALPIGTENTNQGR